MASHLGRFISIYADVSSHILMLSSHLFPFLPPFTSFSLCLGCLHQTRWVSSHGMGLSPPWEAWLADSSQGNHQHGHLLQVPPLLWPTTQPTGVKPSQARPALLLAFRAASPFPHLYRGTSVPLDVSAYSPLPRRPPQSPPCRQR